MIKYINTVVVIKKVVTIINTVKYDVTYINTVVVIKKLLQ
jgi:hypothetical protein